MKKRAALCLILILHLFILPVGANEYKTDELKKYVPEDVMELIPEDIFSDDIEKSASAVSEISGLPFILKYAVHSLSGAFSDLVASFSGVTGIIILGSALRLLLKEEKRAAFDLCSSLCAAAMVFGMQYSVIESVGKYLFDLTALMGGMIPVMSAVYAAGGSLATAAASGSGMLVFVSVCELACAKVILPFTKICFALSITGVLCRDIGISGILKMMKKVAVFVLAFLAAVCSAVLSLQNVIAQASDSAAAKIVKFSLGSLVPIVGGALGDTVKTIFAGLSLVKSSLGVLGVVFVFLLTMPILAKLVVNKFLFGVSSAIASLIGAKNEEKFLSDVSGTQDMLIAVCAISFLMFTTAFGLFIRATLGGGA